MARPFDRALAECYLRTFSARGLWREMATLLVIEVAESAPCAFCGAAAREHFGHPGAAYRGPTPKILEADALHQSERWREWDRARALDPHPT